ARPARRKPGGRPQSRAGCAALSHLAPGRALHRSLTPPSAIRCPPSARDNSGWRAAYGGRRKRRPVDEAVMMRTLLAKALFRLAHWLQSKGMPYALAGAQWSGTSFVDSYKRNRQPTPNEILAELKNTAWTCASINAATCANYPPRLYVITEHNQQRPKCLTKSLSQQSERRLRSLPHLHIRAKSAA